MSAGEARRPVDDRERALLFGAEFGLGTLERVSRNRTLTRPAAWGGLLAVVVALVGGPVAAGVADGPYAPTAKVVVAALVGGLFAACCVLLGVGVRRSSVSNRLFRYSNGLAQLVRDEPEPRVARWADVKDFTVFYFDADDAPPRLTGFLVTTEAGTSLPGLRGYRNRRELRALVAEAEKHLAPRLVPAMTEAYESGAAAAFGRVVVSREGIAVSALDELIEWPQVKSVHLTYIGSQDGDYADQVIVGRKGMPTTEISVSGLPNGIFLPHLLAHVAGRQGVMLTGYRGGPRPTGDERAL